ncbi:MAG TPA: hypothetical protein VGO58_07775 [Chitinophagaceae bacterium]|jgi:hypothetical protein|nr:hypothetical protein [Chitinophagaceae bacterium]
MQTIFRHIILVLLAVQLRASPAYANDSLVYWGRKLSFTDFTAPADPNSGEYALSFVGFAFTYSFDSGGRLSFSVKAYFNPTRSWMRSPDTITLQHEQMHFDLAEITARELCTELASGRQMYTTHDSVAAIVGRYERKLTEWHYRYDAETLYSADLVQHKKWRRKLDRLLDRTGCTAQGELND